MKIRRKYGKTENTEKYVENTEKIRCKYGGNTLNIRKIRKKYVENTEKIRKNTKNTLKIPKITDREDTLLAKKIRKFYFLHFAPHFGQFSDKNLGH